MSELRNAGSSCTPTEPAAAAHWCFKCSVGVTTVTASTVPSASSSAAIRRAKVVLPAPGVATARKSSSRRRRYSTSERRCQARSGGNASSTGRGGAIVLPLVNAEPPPGQRPRGGVRVYRLLVGERVVDLLARRTDRRVGLRHLGHRELLAAQRFDERTQDGALHHLGLVDVVEHLRTGVGFLFPDVRPLHDLRGTAHDTPVCQHGPPYPSRLG